MKHSKARQLYEHTSLFFHQKAYQLDKKTTQNASNGRK